MSHSDTTASGNTSTITYWYAVTACNSYGCSPWTNAAVVPYRPASLVATPAANKINLTWTDRSINETGFQIHRKSGGCLSTNSWGFLANVGPNTTSYSNTGLGSGVTYSYRVRSYYRSWARPYSYGYSLFSNCAQATTP